LVSAKEILGQRVLVGDSRLLCRPLQNVIAEARNEPEAIRPTYTVIARAKPEAICYTPRSYTTDCFTSFAMTLWNGGGLRNAVLKEK
ncbi:MAG TPA: hypothetical protein PLO05_04890, partial [Bacteroidales bacterium]|nr:hypothetical protein [Bacteroidales bacterium]